jgi:hypothetical protein
MRYPEPPEIKLALNHGASPSVIARRYGMTAVEVIEIDTYGAVRESTAAWADALRARFPERYNAKLG